MQDRYAGDVGDFGKLGLLRHIVAEGLRLGINWYLTPNESHNDDGKHISYLKENKKEFLNCDNDLRDRLREIVEENKRAVESFETAKLLENTVYYSKKLECPGGRDSWHAGAVEKLKNCDIVFLDPDNGLLVKSVSLNSPQSIKYVTVDELNSYYTMGKSVIFYNHRSRQKEELYLQRFKKLKIMPEFSGAIWHGIKFRRGTVRDYFFILQPEHKERVEAAIEKVLNSNWKRHFELLSM